MIENRPFKQDQRVRHINTKIEYKIVLNMPGKSVLVETVDKPHARKDIDEDYLEPVEAPCPALVKGSVILGVVLGDFFERSQDPIYNVAVAFQSGRPVEVQMAAQALCGIRKLLHGEPNNKRLARAERDLAECVKNMLPGVPAAGSA